MKFEQMPGRHWAIEALIADLREVELGSPDGVVDKNAMLVLTFGNPIGEQAVKYALALDDVQALHQILTKFFADHPHLEE